MFEWAATTGIFLLTVLGWIHSTAIWKLRDRVRKLEAGDEI